MKKFLKILFSILFVLIVTLIGLTYYLKDDIKKFIKDEINNSVNAKINYKDVSLSLLTDFPNLHVKIDNISVDGIGDFKDVRLAEIDRFTMSLDAKKLLFNEDLEIKKIGLSGADFNIKVLKNGKANYDIAKENKDSISKPEKKYTVKIENIQVDNSNLIYNDAGMDLQMKLKNIQFEGNGVFEGDNYTLETQTTSDTLDVVFDKIHYLNHVKAKVNSKVLIQDQFKRYTLNNIKAKINDLDLVSNMMFFLNGDDIEMDITYQTEQNSLKQLLSLIPKAYMPDLQGVKANGKAVLKGMVKGVYNEQNYPAFKVDFQINNGNIKYPDLPEEVKNINVKTLVNFPGGKSLNQTILDMPSIHFTIADNNLDGKLKVKNMMTDPHINTAFKGNIDLQKIKKAVHIPNLKDLSGILLTDFTLVGKSSDIENQNFDKFTADGYFNLKDFNFQSDSLPYPVHISNAEMKITPQSLQVAKFDSKIGESDFHIQGNIRNYITYFLKKDSVLQARFKMHSDYLNLNRFMSDDATPSTDTTSTGIIKIPKNLDIVFDADATKVKYQDMDLNKVKSKITVKDEVAKLETVLLQTLQGNMMLKGSYDTSKDVAKSDVDISMQQISIPQAATTLTMFKTYTPVLQKVQGNFISNIKMKVDLDDKMNPVLSTMDASGLFNSSNINIAGIDLVKKIGNMLKINELKNPKVDKIKARFAIEKGKLSIKPFGFKLNGMKSKLQGNVSLDKKINFVLDLDIPKDKLGNKANQIIEGLVGKLDKLGLKAGLGDIIKMKFKITGDYNNPKILPVIAGTEGNTVQEVITQAVEQKVEEVVDKAKEKAIAEARKKADALLQQAQIQADRLVAEAKKAGDRIKAEAKKQGDKLIKDAGNDYLKKIAAKTLAKKLNKEADKKANQLVTEARNKGNLLLKNAKEKGDKLIEAAEKK